MALLLFPLLALNAIAQECRLTNFTFGPAQPGDTYEQYTDVYRNMSLTAPPYRVSFSFNTETQYTYVVESGPLEILSTLSRPEQFPWGVQEVVYRHVGQPWVAVSPPLPGTGSNIVFRQGAVWPVAAYRVRVR